MTNPHRIEVTIEPRWGIRARLLCDAPVGAQCRLWCDKGCDSAGEDHADYHELSDTGYCIKTEAWFDDEPFELYHGDEHPLRSGPVELEWQGDTYTWAYPKSDDSGSGGES